MRAVLSIGYFCLAAGVVITPGMASATPGQLLLSSAFPGTAPQDIAHDTTDNTFWVSSFVDGTIQHFSADLTLLGSIPSPFPLGGTTGIAYYSACDTLLVVNATSLQLVEIDKSGAPVFGGVDVFLPLQPVVNPVPTRFLRGLAFYPGGDGGLGSVFVVESVGTLIYEFDLAGTALRWFEHPDDPDGFPGGGASANAGGIEVLVDSMGTLTGFDLIGSDGGNSVVRRLDAAGAYTGLSIPLTAVGAGSGDIGGIVRAPYIDTDGTPFDALYGASESSGGALFVVDGEPDPIAELIEIHCTSAGTTVLLEWTTTQTYDSVLVERNGAAHQLLPGTATSTLDANLPSGVYHYSVYAIAGTLVTPRLECAGVIGAGQVQKSVDLNTVVATPLLYDLTEDAADTLWVTSSSQFVYGFDKELNLIDSFPLSFVTQTDLVAGIAYRDSSSTFLVSNAADNTVHEVDVLGTSVSVPIALQLPSPPGDEPEIAGMTFDAAGDGGAGSLWLIDMRRALIYEVALSGTVLRSIEHPEETAVPTPLQSYFNTYAFGISGVPEVGTGHEEIDVSGASVFERKTRRVTRVDTATGTPDGLVLPAEDIANRGSFFFLSHHNSTHLGSPVAFVVGINFGNCALLRVDRTPPAITPPSFLTCRQTGLLDEVEGTFNNHGPYDSIEVERDGTLIATLPGTATHFVDSAPPPGWRTYRVTARIAGQSAEARRCRVRVGRGAVLQRKIIWPVVSPYQMTRNPADGSFLITTNVPATVDRIYHFDASLNFTGTIPSTATHPDQVAALAVRPTAGSYQIYAILWEQQGHSTGPQLFRMTVQDATGNLISGPTSITIPGPPPADAITYPTGLVHDSRTDTLWLLERNSDTILNLDLAGNLIQSFPHPAPPAQDFVFNLGLALDAPRDAFTATTSGFSDQQITQSVAFTRDGSTIGEEIPLDAAAINPLNGMVRADGKIWVSGAAGSVSQLVELKAADPMATPIDLACTESAPNQVTLTWTETTPTTAVEIRRGGVLIATVAGGTGSHVDSGVGAGARAYTVSTTDGSLVSAPAACSLVVAGSATQFVRGDASGDDNIDIGDAVFILGFLFNAGAAPPCMDAADAGDDGAVNIGDAVYLLTFLFSNGPQPPLPYPAPGGDPTPDTLGC